MQLTSFNLLSYESKFFPVGSDIVEKMIANTELIAFQEWGLTESVRFSKVFTDNNYFVFATYAGLEERDRVATAIAIPLKKYKINKLGYEKLCNYITDPPKDIQLDGPPTTSVINFPENCYILAKKQYHEVSYAVLESDEGTFVLFNVYMPFTFWWKQVMVLHGDALRKIIDKIAGDLPIVLTGIFDYEHGESLHKLMIGEKFDEDLPYQGWEPSKYNRVLTDIHDSHIDIRYKNIYNKIYISDLYVVKAEGQFIPNRSGHHPISATLSSKDHKSYYIAMRDGREIAISKEYFQGCPMVIAPKHDFKVMVVLARISKTERVGGQVLVIKTEKKHVDQCMNQLYTKCNGHLPPISGTYFPAVVDILDDAPEEISDLRFDTDNWYYFAFASSGSEIIGSLFLNPRE